MGRDLMVEVQRGPDSTRITLTGELDLSTTPRLEAALRGADDTSVILDLAPLTFIDFTGLRVLVREHARRQEAGERLTLVSCSPLCTRSELAADVASPSQARALVRRLLQPWEVEREIEIAELLTSELVTNAVRHAATTIMLRVATEAGSLRVEVTDTSAAMPRMRDEPDIGGYGLRIVDELASRWGVERLPDDGKTVWFELDLGMATQRV